MDQRKAVDSHSEPLNLQASGLQGRNSSSFAQGKFFKLLPASFFAPTTRNNGDEGQVRAATGRDCLQTTGSGSE